jgi:Tfp pilus assembly PilM family ATPase
MQIMVGEMKRTLTYFREKLGDTGTTKLYMCGEAANLPGLGGYLTKNLGLESTLVNPVAKIEVAGSAQGKVDPAAMAGFSVAIGLGLKDR